MLPWPKPATWPAVPPDASAEVLAKEKASLCLFLFMGYIVQSSGQAFVCLAKRTF